MQVSSNLYEQASNSGVCGVLCTWNLERTKEDWWTCFFIKRGRETKRAKPKFVCNKTVEAWFREYINTIEMKFCFSRCVMGCRYVPSVFHLFQVDAWLKSWRWRGAGGRRRKKESVKLLHPRVNYLVFLSNVSPLSKILLLESMRSVDACVIALVWEQGLATQEGC